MQSRKHDPRREAERTRLSKWLHLRLCRTCGGHVGCCDDSPNRHATEHFHAAGHPIIEGYDPPEGWGWCYVDEVFLDLSDRITPQLGPIPRNYWRCAKPMIDHWLAHDPEKLQTFRTRYHKINECGARCDSTCTHRGRGATDDQGYL